MALVGKPQIEPGMTGTSRVAFPLFRCPKCWLVGFIDQHQFRGIESIQCPECDYHQTKDWSGENHAKPNS